MADRHLESVARKIADLQRLQVQLSRLREQCAAENPSCPIIEALTAPHD